MEVFTLYGLFPYSLSTCRRLTEAQLVWHSWPSFLKLLLGIREIIMKNEKETKEPTVPTVSSLYGVYSPKRGSWPTVGFAVGLTVGHRKVLPSR